MELKRKQLNNMQVLWCQLMLKDSIKDFACFFSSYQHLKQTFEQVFEAKLPQNNKQIINGFSWVTEDFTLANFIFNRAFSKAFKQSDQTDPNLPEQFRITSHNLTESFVMLYQKVYEDQMRVNFNIFAQSEQKQQALNAVRTCIKMALNVKSLPRDLKSLDWEEFVKTVVDQQTTD